MKTALSRLTSFLMWTWSACDSNDRSFTPDVCFTWFKTVLCDHYHTIGDYCSVYSETVKGVGASTIYNHLCDLSLAFSWFSLGRKVSNHDSTHIPQSDLFKGVYQIMKNLKRSYKVATKKVRGGKKTMTHLQHTLRAPEGGLVEMIRVVISFIPRITSWYNDLISNPPTFSLTKQMYDTVLQLVVCSMYVTTVNGRVSGKYISQHILSFQS